MLSSVMLLMCCKGMSMYLHTCMPHMPHLSNTLAQLQTLRHSAHMQDVCTKSIGFCVSNKYWKINESANDKLG